MNSKLKFLAFTLCCTIICIYTYAQGGSMKKMNLNKFDSVRVDTAVYFQAMKEALVYKFVYKLAYNKKGISILNASNQEIYAPQFGKITWCHDLKQFVVCTYAWYDTEGKHSGQYTYGVLDTLGNWVIPLAYKYINIPEWRDGDGDFAVLNFKDQVLVYYAKNKAGKYGGINCKGAVVFPFEYDYYNQFDEGIGTLRKKESPSDIIKEALVNAKGDLVTGFDYNSIVLGGEVKRDFGETEIWDEQLYSVKKNEKYGFIDRGGKVIIPIDLQDAGLFDVESNSVVAKKNNKYGLLNDKNQTVLPFKYDNIKIVSATVFAVKENNKWGLVSFTDKAISNNKYDDIKIVSKTVLAVKENNKWGLVSFKDKAISDKKYDDISVYNSAANSSSKFIVYRVNDKDGFLDASGKEIVPATYDYIIQMYDKYFLVTIWSTSNKKYGVIDNTGKVIVPVEYEYTYNDAFGFSFGAAFKNQPKDAVNYLVKDKEYYWFFTNGTLRKATKAEIAKE